MSHDALAARAAGPIRVVAADDQRRSFATVLG
jgi:hypothetical protein